MRDIFRALEYSKVRQDEHDVSTFLPFVLDLFKEVLEQLPPRKIAASPSTLKLTLTLSLTREGQFSLEEIVRILEEIVNIKININIVSSNVQYTSTMELHAST